MDLQRQMIRSRYKFPAALMLGAALTIHAQEDENPCKKASRELDSTGTAAVADCIDFATYILDKLTETLYKSADEEIIPRDLQSSSPQGAATGGSLAQDEAVPSVQPLALAGGSVAAVGSDAGANTITALTLNPSLFILGPDEKEAIAKLSRFTDVTLFVPVDELDRDDDGEVDYLGARVRMNLNSFSQGNAIIQEARTLFKKIVESETDLLPKIVSALEGAKDKKKCAEAYVSGGKNIKQSCDGGDDITLDKVQYEAFRKRLQTVREKVDAFYYGLDLRFDLGDPTLGEVKGADGKSLFAGFAYGKRYIDKSLSSAGLRFRLGIRYFDQNDFSDSANNPVKGETDFALEGGFGGDLVKSYLQQSIRLSLGAEFRVGDPPQGKDDAFQTNYMLLRAALSVPITASNNLSVSFAHPAVGKVSPTLSINANWGLLLPDVK